VAARNALSDQLQAKMKTTDLFAFEIGYIMQFRLRGRAPTAIIIAK
jgi:hypothetical protein